MNITYTTIFCIIGKPGTGKTEFIHRVLADEEIMDKTGVLQLIYCSTKKKRYGEQEYEYNFMPINDFKRLDKKSIIEYRSYDTYTGETYYSFTRKDDIIIGNTYVCESSPVQFTNYVKWAKYTELEDPTNQIKVFPIVINSPIFDRIQRMWAKVLTDTDIYEFCNKVLTEKYEFGLFVKDFPEILNDTLDKNSLVINNEEEGEEFVNSCSKQIKQFILTKLNEIATERKEIEEKEIGKI